MNTENLIARLRADGIVVDSNDVTEASDTFADAMLIGIDTLDLWLANGDDMYDMSTTVATLVLNAFTNLEQGV